MKSLIAAAALALATPLAAQNPQTPPAAPTAPPLEVGAVAPDFTLPRSGGGEVSLSSFRGRPVVLAFLRGYA